MIGALIIVLREVVEAGLIVGIVLAVTQTIPHRLRYVVAGVLAGVLGAVLVAMFAGRIAAAVQGNGQEIFNAAILGIAVVMLTWHNVWMARHGREIASDLHRLGDELREGSTTLTALAVVVAVAVLREGSEVVLFLYGIVISDKTSNLALLTGGFAGLLLGVAISLLTFKGLVIIPMRYLFKVTTLLISFIAAGMAVQAVAFLEQADLISVLGHVVWNSSAVLPDKSLIGRALHTLVGYSDSPTQMQLLVYVATLTMIFALMKLFSQAQRESPPQQGSLRGNSARSSHAPAE
ncbi:MAG: FTR1 family protein [Beijerinckiaceae bacterium]